MGYSRLKQVIGIVDNPEEHLQKYFAVVAQLVEQLHGGTLSSPAH